MKGSMSNTRSKNFIIMCLFTVMTISLFGCTKVGDDFDSSENQSVVQTASEQSVSDTDVTEDKTSENAKTDQQTSGTDKTKQQTSGTDKTKQQTSETDKTQQQISETDKTKQQTSGTDKTDPQTAGTDIPDYTDKAFIELNNNQPYFTDDEKKCTDAFENYSDLDAKGRCGVAYANLCKELMPTGERGEIGDIKPSGWHTVKYPDVIEDNYLYNRSHLIAFSLAGENANEKNLITGTRFLNQETMQIFELKVLDYLRSTDNHVLYRVTPVFRDNDLVAAGVQMEAWSVEDEGKGICFNVFCYNVQPGIEIDYATGESKRVINIASSDENANSEDTSAPKSLKENDSSSENEDKASAEIDKQSSSETEKKLDNEKNNEVETGEEKNDEGNSYEETTRDYVLNVNSHRIHLPSCKSVGDILEKNKLEYKGTLKELKDKGYTPCGRCLAEYR